MALKGSMCVYVATLIVVGSFTVVDVFAAGQKKGATRGETCQRIEDVLRIAADKIVAGDASNRVRIALAAHERLNCSINGLIGTLSIPLVDPIELTKPSKEQ